MPLKRIESGGASGSSGAIVVSPGSAASHVTFFGAGTNKIPTRKLNSDVYNSGGYAVIIPATGYINFPPARVSSGATVRIVAHNGSATGNAKPIFVVGSREAAMSATLTGDVLGPDDDKIYPTDNLARIWIAGTPGDGAIASIRQGGDSA